MANHFLGINRDKAIKVNPDFSKEGVREEVRAEGILKTKSPETQNAISPSFDGKMNNPATNREGSSIEMRVENDVARSGAFSPQRLSAPFATTRVNDPDCATPFLKQENQAIQPSAEIRSQLTAPESTETNFIKLIRLCEQRLLDFIKNSGKVLTPERVERIALQAERMATLILHSRGLKGILPPEDEMVNISMRAKYEVSRLPEIQKDLMDEGEENAFRAYRIVERLASIEGRFTYEAMKQGVEPPLHLSYVAKKELERHREQLPHLTEEMKEKYVLSNVAAQHCALDILRYKETHGEPP